MNRCIVENNAKGGIQVATLNFDITNTVIAKNRPGTDMGGVTWGGVRISGTGTAGAARFLNNTVVQNMAAGISCLTDVPIVGSIIFGNATGEAVGCTITPCCSADPILTADYRLSSAATGCIGKLAPAVSALDDIDGQIRANGQMNDCGADEL
jgi:hypothetical protein